MVFDPATRIPFEARKIDCHVHVIEPARFPYPDYVAYRPTGHELGSAQALDHLLAAHGVRHALIVGPNSGYGFDNSCLLDALARGGGRFKGMAVVHGETGPDALRALRAKGVLGVTFNTALLGTDILLGARALLRHLGDLDMWADVQAQGDQWAALRPALLDSGVRVLIDHCGRPDPHAGLDQPGFQALLSLAGTGRAVVKISSVVKTGLRPFPYEDGWRFVRALLDAFTPEAALWGSDWPFLRAPERMDYGPLLDLFGTLVPDADARDAILWRTPMRLFGFGSDRGE